MSKPKENSDITLHCTTCGTSHTILKLGRLKEKIPDLDLKTDHYKHGLCKECDEHLKAGGVFFVDRSGRCVKVSQDASKEKISPEFQGKIICIPAGALNTLIAEYLKAHPNPPSLSFPSGHQGCEGDQQESARDEKPGADRKPDDAVPDTDQSDADLEPEG